MSENEIHNFLTKIMEDFSKKLDVFQEQNSKQHSELFKDVKSLMIKDAEQQGKFILIADKRYSLKSEVENIKDSIKGLNQLADKFMIGLIVMLLGFTGYGMKLFISYMIESVKAFF